jgi:HlyD family secretion protein
MNSALKAIGAVAAVGATLYSVAFFRLEGKSPTTAAIEGQPRPPIDRPRRAVIAAVGAVEPVSEEIDIGSELPGKLDRVLVEEGSAIRAGQVIAVIANREFAAQVASAEATLQERIAALRRVTNGARGAERRQAEADVDAADAELANTLALRDRRRELLQAGAISREEADRAEKAWLVAEAQRRAAAERYRLIDDGAREEDHAQAAAAVALARASVAHAEAMLAKTYVRSPIDGVVLRKHRHTGETVVSLAPDPIVTIGDISRLRVRAEIDELDVAFVRIGQRVRVRADAFSDREFAGTVVKVGQELGKKKVRTELNTERLDTKVLEALVDLDSADGLRPRLRVDVFVEVAGDGHAD